MTRDQMTELKTLQTIMEQSTFEAEVEYNGKMYQTFIWKPEMSDGSSTTAIRVLISDKGWSVLYHISEVLSSINHRLPNS